MPMPALTPLQLDSGVLSVFRQVRPYFSSTCFLLLIWSASAIGYRLPAYPNTSSRVGSSLPSSLCSGSFIHCFPQHIRLCTFRSSATMPPVTLRHGKAFPWLGACAMCFPVSAFVCGPRSVRVCPLLMHLSGVLRVNGPLPSDSVLWLAAGPETFEQLHSVWLLCLRNGEKAACLLSPVCVTQRTSALFQRCCACTSVF